MVGKNRANLRVAKSVIHDDARTRSAMVEAAEAARRRAATQGMVEMMEVLQDGFNVFLSSQH
jgi:Na+/alanine symporter